jgi:cytosine/adenosine deaminase-related metal-dependent hydrolase
VVRGPEDAEAAVAELAAQGIRCVKVYNGLSEAALLAIQRAAARRGLRVIGHVPFAVPFESLAGLEVQHLMGLTDDWSAVSDERIEAYAAHSAAAGISHTPTLVTFAHAARLGGDPGPEGAAAAALLPRVYRELIWDPAANPLIFLLNPEGSAGAARPEAMARTVRRLLAHGVPVLAGTDSMNPFVAPGAGLLEELQLLAAAGLGLEGALETATRRAGEVLGVPGLGRLEAGAPADLALFRGDPTRDPAALGRLAAVVARGRLYDRAELLAAAARQRAYFEGPLYAPLFRAAARAVIRATRPADL